MQMKPKLIKRSALSRRKLIAGGGIAPTGLICELMAHPDRVAIDNSKPTFAWIVEEPGVDAVQIAYQIQVATRTELLNSDRTDLWDSGKVMGDKSCGVVYSGSPL